jgi:DNA-binding NarL/FixJ family response regulator
VLVIEDQSAVCDLVAEMIQSHPRCVSVGTASDGLSAVEMALRLKPDILVLDVVMPGISGLEVMRRLGNGLPSTRVLIFSGKQEPHIVRALMQAGIHGFVNKNGPLNELRVRRRQYLVQRGLRPHGPPGVGHHHAARRGDARPTHPP